MATTKKEIKNYKLKTEIGIDCVGVQTHYLYGACVAFHLLHGFDKNDIKQMGDTQLFESN